MPRLSVSAVLTRLKHYGWNLLVALDRWTNAMTGGDPAMTLSGRLGKSAAIPGRCGFCTWVCKWLDRIDQGHCARQAANEKHLGSDEILK